MLGSSTLLAEGSLRLPPAQHASVPKGLPNGLQRCTKRRGQQLHTKARLRHVVGAAHHTTQHARQLGAHYCTLRHAQLRPHGYVHIMLPLATSTCAAGRVQGAFPCQGSCSSAPVCEFTSECNHDSPATPHITGTGVVVYHHAQHKQPYAPAHIPDQAVLTCPNATTRRS